MPDPITQTVEVEGEEVEVTVDPTEHGYVSGQEVAARVEKAVRNARKGRYALDDIPQSEEVLDRLAQSDETLEQLRERRPDVFRNGGSESEPDEGKLEERLEEHRKAWEAKHKKPLETKLEELSQHNERLVRDRMDRDVLQAFEGAEVRRDKGQRELIREYYRGRVAYSAEHDETFLVDEDGEFLPSGDGETPFLTVEADLAQKRENEDYGSWFADKTRPGSGFGGAGDGAPSGKLQDMSEQDKIDYINKHGATAYQELVRKSYRAG